MKRIAASMLALCLGALTLSAQMSDSQIISYVEQGIEAGKSRSELGRELLAKGVSSEQVTRLMQAYSKSEGSDGPASYSTPSSRMVDRQRSAPAEKDPLPDMTVSEGVKSGELKIFGHDLFTLKNLSFEPNENAATPSDYVIGPGDVILIDVWGVNEASIEEKVSPEGKISIAQVGPVTLSGLTIAQATSRLKSALSQKYSLTGPDAGSQISVTLGNVRTVKVNVLGEVKVPGTYRLSSFSTVFSALYRAGGVSDIGSLRAIQLSRGGKIIQTVDLYKFIFDGQKAGNVTLADDDAIIVPPYQSLVEVNGGVKRPMAYETLPGESVDDIITYCGGFSSKAYSGSLTIERMDGETSTVLEVLSSVYASTPVADGDVLSVKENKREDIFTNRVEVRGCVMRPGTYAIGGSVATVRQLVESAGGLLENAFLQRAQLVREREDRSLEVLSIALGAIMSSGAADVMLRRNDVLIVSDTNEMNPKGDVSINGYVNSPGQFPFGENMSVEDLIMLAGGLKPGASLARVDVARRIYDASGTEAPDSLAEVFSYSIRDGLPVDGTPSFILKPYDVVSVRKSPSYLEQKTVTVSGEVLFPGEYALVSNNERLSDIFKRAGEATPNAYISGATLRRKFTDAEKVTRKKLDLLADSKQDSLNISRVTLEDSYYVGIRLDKALSEPGGDYDVVLSAGDELIVPPVINTVRIQGEVFYPNAVNYVEGKNLSYYIKQAGGFSKEALRGDVYVVYLNGEVSHGMSSEVLPGSEIVVPTRPQRHKMTVGEWIGIGTSAASLTTMIISICNLLK